MKTKRKQQLSVSLIFILVISTVLVPMSHIFASSSSQDSSGNSGGFIIETAKVDGSMDLIGALTGNITIYEGEIHGLTITKVMERGNGLEPLVVRISAPGPIPVKNLNAQTMNNELPNIGGLCKPGQPGWICMENVVMNVEEQFVESISLTNANVHTCYLSECGSLPKYNPLISLEQLEELLNGSDEESGDEIQDIMDLIDNQEELVEQLDGLLGNVSEIIDELLNQDLVGKVIQVITEAETAITSKLGLDDLLPKIHDIPSIMEYVDSQLSTSTEFLNEGETMIGEIDNSLPTIDKLITDYEKNKEELLTIQEQHGVYATLIELAELQKAGKEIDYSPEAYLEMETDKQEVQSLRDRLDTLKDKLDEQKKLFEKLSSDVETIDADREKAEEDVIGLQALLEQLGLGSDDDNSEEGLLDPVIDPVEENVLDPVKEEVLDPVLDPIKENVLDPVIDPVKDNVLDPVKEKVVDPVLDPVKDHVIDPVKEEVLEPILDPITGKLIDPITGEVIDLILDPISENLLDPITGKVIIPILNPLTGKIINPLTGEIVDRVFNQETGELLNPYKDSFLKRLLEKILNPFNW